MPAPQPAVRRIRAKEAIEMIAQELEVSLHMAFVEARQKQHEFITVEHLLLAMLDNPSAAEVLKACGVDLDELRGVLTDFISEHTPTVSGEDANQSRHSSWPNTTTWSRSGTLSSSSRKKRPRAGRSPSSGK